MRNFASDRAQGPKGFQPIFFKASESMSKVDIVEAVKDFFAISTIPNAWRATYITLFSKKENLM